MSKAYLPCDPDQQLLLPQALQEWLPQRHLAYFISDVVDQLDRSQITARYEGERRGVPPCHPRMTVKVLICTAIASGRRHRGGWRSGCTRTSPSGCWRPTTRGPRIKYG